MTIKSIIKEKSLGILMHPSSLPGQSESGTFGTVAKDWIRKISKYGINYWQFLPLTPTDSTGSPYSSPSSFALNPWFLDIDDLIEKRFIFISSKEKLGIINNDKNHFDFDLADNLSKELGKHLLNGWEFQSEQRKENFLNWIRNNSWVEDYSIFMVLREEFNMLPWWQWPLEFKKKK